MVEKTRKLQWQKDLGGRNICFYSSNSTLDISERLQMKRGGMMLRSLDRQQERTTKLPEKCNLNRVGVRQRKL